mmetsp:Transcript_16706/g.47959  ORF Transcript_16706/g.47959 Transcript_16706/m.47959 type:complete len:92 (-) Transcript_16706:42-317(-)
MRLGDKEKKPQRVDVIESTASWRLCRAPEPMSPRVLLEFCKRRWDQWESLSATRSKVEILSWRLQTSTKDVLRRNRRPTDPKPALYSENQK